MRIKFNDKIYRLKEIESGVDSLMELVEEPKYNHGDFVYEDGRIMIVNEFSIKRIVYHALIYPQFDLEVVYNDNYAAPIAVSSLNFRYATEEEKQLLIDAMKKDGKRWNAEMKCIEDIPKPKFKVGDKVRIKDGISSKNTNGSGLYFNPKMDEFIGKEMNVVGYRVDGWISCDPGSWCFDEDWLEPATELKRGDLAIFWDSDQAEARIGVYNQFYDGSPFPHEDHIGRGFKNAVKFERKKQFKRFIKGEL